ncbi:MAG: hypothetical protein J2P48_23735, partial [Alphaproteobacteria bacterium]|nr:hypothetical protein [Alphaproteobacteria bacterium]
HRPPIAVSDAAVCRKSLASVEEAQREIGEFLELAALRRASTRRRRRARRSWHSLATAEGTGTRYNSTPGDRFACAVAKNHRTALLFQGEDVEKTDITPLPV